MKTNSNKENINLFSNTIKIKQKLSTKYKSLENKPLPKFQFNISFQQNSNSNPQSISNQQKNTPQFAPINSKQNRVQNDCKQIKIKPKKLKFTDCYSSKDISKNVRYGPLICRSNKIPESFLRQIGQKKRSLEYIKKSPSVMKGERVSFKQEYLNEWNTKRIQGSDKMKEFGFRNEQVQRMRSFFNDKTSIQLENWNNCGIKKGLKYKKMVKIL